MGFKGSWSSPKEGDSTGRGDRQLWATKGGGARDDLGSWLLAQRRREVPPRGEADAVGLQHRGQVQPTLAPSLWLER